MRVSSVERSVVSNISTGGQATIKVSPKAFKVLFDLYSNKLESVCRELMANCYDAHISVGIEKSFIAEVIKTDLDENEPVLRFRDFGPGISKDDISHVYMTFFESTKNDSNSQVGAFGLGAKSPWCYTEVYTVKSFQHGMVCTYALYLDEAGYPCCALVNEELTEEPTGLEVLVPLNSNDVSTAEQLIEKLTVGYVLAGTKNKAEVQVEAPSPVVSFAGLKIYDFNVRRCVHVLYGVTVYPLDNEVLNRLVQRGSDNLKVAYKELSSFLNGGTLLLHAPLGVLDLVPSRESLSYDERSLATILAMLEAAAENYLREFNTRFSKRSNLRLMLAFRKNQQVSFFFQRKARQEESRENLFIGMVLTEFDKYRKTNGTFVDSFQYFKSTNCFIAPLPDFYVKKESLSYEQGLQVNRELTRLRRIVRFTHQSIYVVTKGTADYLREHHFKILTPSKILELDKKAKEWVRSQAKERPDIKTFSVWYGSELNQKRYEAADYLELESDDQRRLDRIVARGKKVLLIPMDKIGPKAPVGFVRTRSDFQRSIPRFFENLKTLGVIQDSDVFVFYNTKLPPVKGFNAWPILHGRWEHQSIRLKALFDRTSEQSYFSHNLVMKTIFELTGDAVIETDSIKAMEDRCSLLHRASYDLKNQPFKLIKGFHDWFKHSVDSISHYGVEDKLTEKLSKNYPLLMWLTVDSASVEKIKDYIKMVDANRKGEVYNAIS